MCGPLTACLPCMCVLAWVWAVGRSGGLLRLLVVGCVWRMSSGPVVVGGVARACLCRVCWWVVLVAVVVSWLGCRGRCAWWGWCCRGGGVIDTPHVRLGVVGAIAEGVRAGRALMGSILLRASVG